MGSAEKTDNYKQTRSGRKNKTNKQKHQKPLEFFYFSIPLLARKQERADILTSVTPPHAHLNWTVHRGQPESASLHVLQTQVSQLG